MQGWRRPDYSKNIVVDEKDHPYTGTKYAWVRARCVGGKTNIWGRLALRLSDYDFKAESRDGFGEDWPICYADIAPYYDKVDLYLGISGHKENLPYLPDSLFQRAIRLNPAEIQLREAWRRWAGVLTPYRAGVTTDGLKHNKYRSRCFGRGACDRRVGGCDIHAAFDSPTGLIHPAMDTGNLTLRTNATVYEVTVDKNTGKASGVSFIDTETGKTYAAKGRSVLLGASTLESARLMLLSKSSQLSERHRQLQRPCGPQFLRAPDGTGRYGLVKELVGKPRTLDDGRPGGFYLARFRNLTERQRELHPRLRIRGRQRDQMFPGTPMARRDSARHTRRTVRDYAGAYISMGAFGEVLPRYENYVDLDPEVKDSWGIPVLRFHYQFGDNEKKMAADMADSAREMFEAAGIEVISVDREILTEGWSIHELGTSRMGNGPEDFGAEPVPAVARREEPVGGGWQHARERFVPEPDLDHHGAVLALLRSPGRGDEERERLMPHEIHRRDLIRIGAAAALAGRAGFAAVEPPKFFTPPNSPCSTN